MAPYSKKDPFVLVCGEIIKHTREMEQKKARDKAKKVWDVVEIDEVDEFLEAFPDYAG